MIKSKFSDIRSKKLGQRVILSVMREFFVGCKCFELWQQMWFKQYAYLLKFVKWLQFIDYELYFNIFN